VRPAALAAAVAGCAPPTAAFDHLRAYAMAADGLALGPDAADVHVLRADLGPPTLQRIELERGRELDRFQPGGAARILHVDEGGGGPSALLQIGDTLTDVTPEAATVRYESGGALTGAAPVGESTVALESTSASGCVLRWVEADAPVPLPRDACETGDVIGLDPSAGADLAVVSAAGGAWVVDRAAAAPIEASGRLMAWEPLTGAVITADPGGTELRSTLLDGFPLWTTALGEPLVGLAPLGGTGTLALITRPGDAGRLILFDAVSGQALTALDLPLPPRALSAAGDGQTLVVAFAQEVHAFRIDEEAAR
jgi:hypothetical protein